MYGDLHVRKPTAAMHEHSCVYGAFAKRFSYTTVDATPVPRVSHVEFPNVDTEICNGQTPQFCTRLATP